MIRKMLLAGSLLWITGLCLQAQEVVIAEDLRGDTLVAEFGMNRKHYLHSFLGAHFSSGTADDPRGDVSMGNSWTLEYGFRYKRRFSQVFSGGLETSLKRASYHPDQFLLPDLAEEYTYKREKFVFLSLGMAAYQRINYGKRGNYIGRFVDVGLYGDLHYNLRQIIRYSGTDDHLRLRRSRMDIHHLFEYGVLARVGFNNFVIKGTYRLSEIFTAQSGLAEFPRFKLGLEIGIHPL
ncbi:MAG: hypothetical protein R6U64_09580 [Bacteroidales bacterium]